MGGHGHGDSYKVPDPSIYKVEEIPILKEVKESLARQGLKDPWLRNEVWRYEPKGMGTHRSRALKFFTRGLPLGFAAFLVTISAEYAYAAAMGDKHNDGHKKHH